MDNVILEAPMIEPFHDNHMPNHDDAILHDVLSSCGGGTHIYLHAPGMFLSR